MFSNSNQITNARVSRDSSVNNVQSSTTDRLPIRVLSSEPIRRIGSMLYNNEDNSVYVSKRLAAGGIGWAEIRDSDAPPSSLIQDTDADTSVTTEAVANTIVFTNGGTESGRFSTDGVLTIRSGTEMSEQATAPGTGGASTGRVWVRDDAPTSLIFTDDTGNDIQLNPHIQRFTSSNASVTIPDGATKMRVSGIGGGGGGGANGVNGGGGGGAGGGHWNLIVDIPNTETDLNVTIGSGGSGGVGGDGVDGGNTTIVSNQTGIIALRMGGGAGGDTNGGGGGSTGAQATSQSGASAGTFVPGTSWPGVAGASGGNDGASGSNGNTGNFGNSSFGGSGGGGGANAGGPGGDGGASGWYNGAPGGTGTDSGGGGGSSMYGPGGDGGDGTTAGSPAPPTSYGAGGGGGGDGEDGGAGADGFVEIEWVYTR